MRFVRYGYRRIHFHLRMQGVRVGQHRVRQWMRACGYAQQGAVRDSGRTPGQKPPEPTGPNQAWQIDATKAYTEQDSWIWVTSILDTYDRRIVACVVRKSCRTEEAQDALALGLDSAFGLERAAGLSIIHDRGSQFTAWSFAERLREAGVREVVTAVHHPQSCGRLERWHRTLKEECLHLQEWQTLAEVEAAVREYVRFYNEERIHSALGKRTPMAYHQAAQDSLPRAA